MSLNILFATINNPYGRLPVGGAETSCRLLAEKLVQRGHKVLYLTDAMDGSARKNASGAGVNLYAPPKIRGRRFRTMGQLAKQRWPLTVRYLCWRHHVGLIYCFYEPPVVEAALSCRTALSYPKVVMRMAGLHWHVVSNKKPEMIGVYERIFNEIDSVNYISDDLVEMTAERMKDLRFDARFKHSRVLDIGTSLEQRSSDTARKSDRSVFNVIMATRFSKYAKRQDLLIRAMAHLPNDHTVHLTFIGEGANLSEMQRLSRDLGVSDNITFQPFMKQSELFDLMDRQHLLCHACDFEGLGKIILESMTRGLPVLVSDVAPLNGYIENGLNGFLVENTPEAWAQKLHILSRASGALARVAEEAARFARMNWSADQNVLKYEEYFQDVIARG
jgi:L-malate glycosyltransferase